MVVVRYSSLIIISLFLLAFSSGCVAHAEKKNNESVVIVETIVPMTLKNESQPLVKIEILNATAEDTEEEFMYRSHGRYLNESFKIERMNVSGDKDLYLDISVYDYKFMKRYQESAADSWGTFKWWTHVAPEGQKFLFVFLRTEMEGSDKSKDPRIWGFESSHFAVQIQNQMAPIDWTHSPCIVIKEMQDKPTFNKESRVSDYGKLNSYTLSKPGSGSECQDLGWLRMGESNQWDGYLIYVVPDSVTEKDIQVLGSFDAFGNAWWLLTKRPEYSGRWFT